MFTKLFSWLFKDKTEQRERTAEEKALIARMLEQANYIASGREIIDDKLPPPVIPETKEDCSMTEIEELEKLRKKILDAARKSLDANRECYMSLWALQNPDENFSKWTLCYQPSWHSDNGVDRFWMEKR